ncbi:unnamed protein product [Echinostoma caproni]|uniref:CDT1 domain-containing protein n=1 Tax=Echinostoma caproni TaxID=27848 RepID=A0A183ATW8_9TREM|nr:unnamed protein product [Echinostoma caproni]
MLRKILFDANKEKPFTQCHLIGASQIFMIPAPELDSKVLRIRASKFNSKLEFHLKSVHRSYSQSFLRIDIDPMKELLRHNQWSKSFGAKTQILDGPHIRLCELKLIERCKVDKQPLSSDVKDQALKIGLLDSHQHEVTDSQTGSRMKYNFSTEIVDPEADVETWEKLRETDMEFLKPPKTLSTPPTAPLDLGDYELADDLSASFEASLLASLKEAAMGSSKKDSSSMESVDRQSPCRTTHIPGSTAPLSAGDLRPNEKSSVVSAKRPVPQRTEALPTRSSRSFAHIPKPWTDTKRPDPSNMEHHRNRIHEEASFSDDESSLATTTAGLGSLVNFPHPRRQPVVPDSARTTQPSTVSDSFSEEAPIVRTPLTPVNVRTSFCRMDSLDETSLMLTDNSVLSAVMDLE